MSVKKQIPSLCKLFSIYEEIPEEFLGETDVDSFFYHNIFDISESQQRIVRVSRGSNKKSFAIKLFHFWDLKTQQRYILKEEVKIFKSELTSLMNKLRDFLKTFDQASKSIQIPQQKPKVDIGSTKSKYNFFAHYYKDIIEHPIRKFLYHSELETTILAYFSSTTLNYAAISLFSQKLSTLTILKFTISTRTDLTLQISVKYLKAFTMCSALTPDCGHENNNIILNGHVYCPNTKCLGKLCLYKKTFQSLGRSDYQCPQCASVCQVRRIPFEDQTNSFFLVAWSKGLHFWREPKISSRCYWRCLLSWQVLFQQRKMRISWWLCNNSEVHLCFWKVWSLVVCSKSYFHITRARKGEKTDKTQFFFARKIFTWYPTKNYYLMCYFNQPNIGRKICGWTTKYERLLEMCIVQHVEIKSVFTFLPIKRLVSTIVESAKPAATFWMFVFKTKNRQLCCLVVTVHIALQERRFATTKKKNYEKEKKILRRAQPSTSKPEPKKVKMSPIME